MISFQNVTANYGKTPIIKDISFILRANQRLCILGPNGSGKTTLLRVFAGLLPYSGSIQVHKQELSRIKPLLRAKTIALMEQIQSIPFEYNVFETVLLGRYRHSSSIFSHWSKEDKEITSSILVENNLWELRDTPITQLSGGQLQRVFFAQTMAQSPQIILLDEPTNHLDLPFQVQLIDNVRGWSEKTGGTVIGVFHDINLAVTLGDYFILLQEGSIYAQGDAEEVLTSSNLEAVYGMNVTEYMKQSFKRWEQLNK